MLHVIDLQKSFGKKDLGKLHKKKVTDKKGKITTVWVKNGEGSKEKKSEVKKKDAKTDKTDAILTKVQQRAIASGKVPVAYMRKIMATLQSHLKTDLSLAETKKEKKAIEIKYAQALTLVRDNLPKDNRYR